MSLWKRAGCHTDSKAFEKSIVARIVREPGLGLLNPWSRPSRTETVLVGRENGIGL